MGLWYIIMKRYNIVYGQMNLDGIKFLKKIEAKIWPKLMIYYRYKHAQEDKSQIDKSQNMVGMRVLAQISERGTRSLGECSEMSLKALAYVSEMDLRSLTYIIKPLAACSIAQW